MGRRARSFVPFGVSLPAMDRRRLVLPLASVLLLAAAFACDVWTGSEVASSLFYVVAILFGAWFVGDRAGRTLAILSVACWWIAWRIAAKPDPSNPAAPHVNTLYWNLLVELAIYLIVAVAVARTRLGLERLRSTARELAAARDALDKETRAVGDLQREMLPQATPEVPARPWAVRHRLHRAARARDGPDRVLARGAPAAVARAAWRARGGATGAPRRSAARAASGHHVRVR
jgi:hypothetical protein